MSPLMNVCHRHRLLYPAGQRCPSCTPRRRPRDPEHKGVMDSYRWKKARAAARRRDGGCVLRGRGDCAGRLEVHHLVKPRDGGDPYALENLRTVCRAHHEFAERR